jgi:hypothetical protein
MQLSFKNWLEIFGGHTPPKQDPTQVGSLGFSDYHGPQGTDPRNPDAQLPPITKKKKKKR